MSVEDSIMSWNCRGTASRDFVCEMNERLREFRLKIVTLLEPRISSKTADNICKKYREEKVGEVGGNWVQRGCFGSLG